MISLEKLRKLAKLARIDVSNQEEKMLNLLNSDIESIKNVYDVDTEGLEVLNNPYDIILEMNEDIVIDGDKQKELMNCAPNSMYNYYIVPKVIE